MRVRPLKLFMTVLLERKELFSNNDDDMCSEPYFRTMLG